MGCRVALSCRSCSRDGPVLVAPAAVFVALLVRLRASTVDKIRVIEIYKRRVAGRDVVIGVDGAERFFATHGESPCFCLYADSEDEALDKAERAFEAFERKRRSK